MEQQIFAINEEYAQDFDSEDNPYDNQSASEEILNSTTEKKQIMTLEVEGQKFVYEATDLSDDKAYTQQLDTYTDQQLLTGGLISKIDKNAGKLIIDSFQNKTPEEVTELFRAYKLFMVNWKILTETSKWDEAPKISIATATREIRKRKEQKPVSIYNKLWGEQTIPTLFDNGIVKNSTYKVGQQDTDILKIPYVEVAGKDSLTPYTTNAAITLAMWYGKRDSPGIVKLGSAVLEGKLFARYKTVLGIGNIDYDKLYTNYIRPTADRFISRNGNKYTLLDLQNVEPVDNLKLNPLLLRAKPLLDKFVKIPLYGLYENLKKDLKIEPYTYAALKLDRRARESIGDWCKEPYTMWSSIDNGISTLRKWYVAIKDFATIPLPKIAYGHAQTGKDNWGSLLDMYQILKCSDDVLEWNQEKDYSVSPPGEFVYDFSGHPLGTGPFTKSRANIDLDNKEQVSPIEKSALVSYGDETVEIVEDAGNINPTRAVPADVLKILPRFTDKMNYNIQGGKIKPDGPIIIFSDTYLTPSTTMYQANPDQTKAGVDMSYQQKLYAIYARMVDAGHIVVFKCFPVPAQAGQNLGFSFKWMDALFAGTAIRPYLYTRPHNGEVIVMISRPEVLMKYKINIAVKETRANLALTPTITKDLSRIVETRMALSNALRNFMLMTGIFGQSVYPMVEKYDYMMTYFLSPTIHHASTDYHAPEVELMTLKEPAKEKKQKATKRKEVGTPVQKAALTLLNTKS